MVPHCLGPTRCKEGCLHPANAWIKGDSNRLPERNLDAATQWGKCILNEDMRQRPRILQQLHPSTCQCYMRYSTISSHVFGKMVVRLLSPLPSDGCRIADNILVNFHCREPGDLLHLPARMHGLQVIVNTMENASTVCAFPHGSWKQPAKRSRCPQTCRAHHSLWLWQSDGGLPM